MKKLISVLLLIALFCTAFAGSAFALTEEEEALYAKYADLIALMENEDYEAAYEAFQAMMPEPEYEEVVLTEENFFDYFEIVTAEPYIERDSAGVIKTVYPGGLQLRMKEDFAKRLDWENSTLSVGITAKKDMYRAKIDFETGEITLGDSSDSDVKKAVKKLDWFESKVDTHVDGVYSLYTVANDPFWYKHPTYKSWSSGWAEPGVKTKYYQVVYRDIELVNLEGTLFLAK